MLLTRVWAREEPFGTELAEIVADDSSFVATGAEG